MCLIVVAWQVHPDFPLVVAANRDEYYARPTAHAQHWPDQPTVLGGRDLEAGGTWLGLAETGRFAAVTNVREPAPAPGKRSRGALTHDFLAGDVSPEAYARQIVDDEYAGFNLLLCDGRSLVYRSNRAPESRALPPGVYGLSNHLLDSPWPKLLSARQRLTAALPELPDRTPLFDLLTDRDIVPDDELPTTGVPLAWERLLSAIFVHSENYGTRASTVVTWHRTGTVRLCEHSFDAHGQRAHLSEISTSVKHGT